MFAHLGVAIALRLRFIHEALYAKGLMTLPSCSEMTPLMLRGVKVLSLVCGILACRSADSCTLSQ